MFRLWYRRPEDSPPRRRSQVSSARYTATVTLEATPVRAQSAAPRSGPLGRCATGLGCTTDGLELRGPEPRIRGEALLSMNGQGQNRTADTRIFSRRVQRRVIDTTGQYQLLPVRASALRPPPRAVVVLVLSGTGSGCGGQPGDNGKALRPRLRQPVPLGHERRGL